MQAVRKAGSILSISLIFYLNLTLGQPWHVMGRAEAWPLPAALSSALSKIRRMAHWDKDLDLAAWRAIGLHHLRPAVHSEASQQHHTLGHQLRALVVLLHL